MKLIYEKSSPGRPGVQMTSIKISDSEEIPSKYLRKTPAELPEVSEAEVVRHFTALSRLNYSIDTHFYPLGSCTMKYNPKACEAAANIPELTDVHPMWPQLWGGGMLTQGSLAILYRTERMLSEITGLDEFTLQPMAGAHGELTGVMLMAAYHADKGNYQKDHIIVPDSAHGTNPASAMLAGYDVVTIPSDDKGMMDFDLFTEALNEKTAGVMLTCPNTLGVFNTRIKDICDAVHAVDGLMYYDGANFNAIMGRYKPGEIGFDICHLNLHKSFATPHGGGGPGAGPVGVVEKLIPYLPISRVKRRKEGTYVLHYDEPKSIGYIAPFYGNFGILVRAYAYMVSLGKEGLLATSNRAVLNANYLRERLRSSFGIETSERCMHEFVFSGEFLKKNGIHVLDIAKGLIDKGFHPPTIYFPLNVPEAIMIEPTETEDLDTLDRFVSVLKELFEVADKNPESLHQAPITTPVGRLDELKAAKDMILSCQ